MFALDGHVWFSEQFTSKSPIVLSYTLISFTLLLDKI